MLCLQPHILGGRVGLSGDYPPAPQEAAAPERSGGGALRRLIKQVVGELVDVIRRFREMLRENPAALFYDGAERFGGAPSTDPRGNFPGHGLPCLVGDFSVDVPVAQN